jgi:hypothetical protein
LLPEGCTIVAWRTPDDRRKENASLEASTAVTPAGVPAAPTAVAATAIITAGAPGATVTWTAGAANGAAITNYLVEQSTDGTTFTTSEGALSGTTATVNGLAKATSYRFQVTATNAVGTGPASAVSAAITTADVPGPPRSRLGRRLAWACRCPGQRQAESSPLARQRRAANTGPVWLASLSDFCFAAVRRGHGTRRSVA